MPKKRLSMRKIRELLRLKHELGRSHREIAGSLGVSSSTVSYSLRRAREAGVSWPLPEGAGRRGAGGGAVPGPSVVAGRPPGAGLEAGAPGASASQGGDAAAAVAGVPGLAPGRLPVQPVLPALPGVAGAGGRRHAAGVPGGREGIRRLRGPEVRDRGRGVHPRNRPRPDRRRRSHPHPARRPRQHPRLRDYAHSSNGKES